MSFGWCWWLAECWLVVDDWLLLRSRRLTIYFQFPSLRALMICVPWVWWLAQWFVVTTMPYTKTVKASDINKITCSLIQVTHWFMTLVSLMSQDAEFLINNRISFIFTPQNRCHWLWILSQHLLSQLSFRNCIGMDWHFIMTTQTIDTRGLTRLSHVSSSVLSILSNGVRHVR